MLPGEAATFTVTVSNPDLVLDRQADLTVVPGLPTNWTWNFTPDRLAIAHQSNATSTLSIFVPSDAQPQTVTLAYDAVDGFAPAARGMVNVTVKPRPVTTVDSQPPAPPHVTLAIAGASSAQSGEAAQGALTVTNDDALRSFLAIHFTATAPSGWRAYFKAGDQDRTLGQGQTVTLPVFVEVPTLAEDTVVNVTITANVDGTEYKARWSVTGLAPPPAPEVQSDDGSAAPAATTSSGASIPGRASPTGPGFELLVEPLEIEIPADGSETATVKVTNTGDSALTILLTAPAPTAWRPIELLPREVTLAPGERQEVPMKVYAPDVPAGGKRDVVVAGSSAGLVRSATLHVTVGARALPADPKDTSAATLQAPAPEGTGLPSVGPAALVAVGLAAAGSGALVLVNRPLREKAIWLGVGLYTRLARPDVLGHEDREKLYRLVETQPGIHFHALQRDLAWNTGTLTYHLRVLEKHGFMVSRRDGLYRRFYLSGAAPRKETFENQGPTGLRADVMEAIRNAPGISQSDLALGLSANKQTVNYHVKALERAGTIRVEKRGRDTFLYAADAPSTSTDPAHA
ncbi:MAG TPA: winged helix-turn-helix transcriptional regulator [Candidatus Thermoplasmatota archaeon]|nr:winged helix-turn-helix transcriptional regulator [Candidatus Thermoplasmatota archaeon]